jgi:hypothetical protein
MQEGMFAEALGKWEAAIHLTPMEAVLHEQKAQLLLEIGRSWGAVQAATSLFLMLLVYPVFLQLLFVAAI